MSGKKTDVWEPVLVYSIVLTGGCALLSYLIYYAGGTFTSCITPIVLALVAVKTQSRIAFMLVPIAVFASLGVALVWDFVQISNDQALLLAAVAFISIAASLRLGSMMSKEIAKASTGRMIYDPVETNAVQPVVAPSHLVSIVFFLAAWWVAGYLISDFASAAGDREVFYEYQAWLRRTFRLVPWAYSGIKVVIILAMSFSVVHGILSYLHCRNRLGLMPSIRLRNELWRWNGREQRLIGKAVARQKQWDMHE